jgi:hypothetical protein
LADRAAAAEREVSHKTDPHVAIEQSPGINVIKAFMPIIY